MSKTEAIVERLAGMTPSDRFLPVSNVGFDLEGEQRMAAGYRQTVEVCEGVPVWYTTDGVPASEGLPFDEARRRSIITGQLNFGRVSRLRG